MNSCKVNPISEHCGLLQPCGFTVSGSVCGPKGQTQNAVHGTVQPINVRCDTLKRYLHNSSYLVLKFIRKITGSMKNNFFLEIKSVYCHFIK